MEMDGVGTYFSHFIFSIFLFLSLILLWIVVRTVQIVLANSPSEKAF